MRQRGETRWLDVTVIRVDRHTHIHMSGCAVFVQTASRVYLSLRCHWLSRLWPAAGSAGIQSQRLWRPGAAAALRFLPVEEGREHDCEPTLPGQWISRRNGNLTCSTNKSILSSLLAEEVWVCDLHAGISWNDSYQSQKDRGGSHCQTAQVMILDTPRANDNVFWRASSIYHQMRAESLKINQTGQKGICLM